jgi:hypothetical protein
MHLGRVLEMAESSKTRFEYQSKIIDRFGGRKELELVAPELGAVLPDDCDPAMLDRPIAEMPTHD